MFPCMSHFPHNRPLVITSRMSEEMCTRGISLGSLLPPPPPTHTLPVGCLAPDHLWVGGLASFQRDLLEVSQEQSATPLAPPGGKQFTDGAGVASLHAAEVTHSDRRSYQSSTLNLGFHSPEILQSAYPLRAPLTD